MGIWDFISGSTDAVKGLVLSSYNHGSAMVTKSKEVSADALQKVNHHGSVAITKGKEVSVDALQKVNHHLSDPQTRSKISRVATDVAKNATIEGLKSIPGAYPTYKIVSKSISDDDKKLESENESKKQKKELKILQATVSKLEKEVSVLCQQVEASVKPEGENQVHSIMEFIRSHF